MTKIFAAVLALGLIFGAATMTYASEGSWSYGDQIKAGQQ